MCLPPLMCPLQTWPPPWLSAHVQHRAHGCMHTHAKHRRWQRTEHWHLCTENAFPRSSMDGWILPSPRAFAPLLAPVPRVSPLPLRAPHYSRTETRNEALADSEGQLLSFPSPTARRALRDRASTWGREGRNKDGEKQEGGERRPWKGFVSHFSNGFCRPCHYGKIQMLDHLRPNSVDWNVSIYVI